jgi:4-hydroxy-tetrahydrodipicolinate synthase
LGSRAERRRTIECGVDEAAGRLPVMAGIGALRTSEAVCLGQDAAAIGADAVLLAPVSYTPLTEEEVFRHVAAVADAVDLPLCLYHNPGTTNFTFTPALIGRLSRVARIVAVKTPAPDPAAMDPRAGPGRDGGGIGDPSRRNGTRFFHWRRGRCQGGRGPPGRLPGLYSVLSGILPELCVPILRAVQSGDSGRTRALNASLQPLWDAFTAHSSLRVAYGIAALLGHRQVVPPRPILPLDPMALRDSASLLVSLGIRL